MNNDPNLKKLLLTRADAAEALGVSVTTIRRLENGNRLKPFRLSKSPVGQVYCYSACNFDPLSAGIGVQN
jgi:hypothetical protein